VRSLIAFIPSPHTGVVHIGPLTLHMYGLTLLVAILACIWLTGRRWVAMGGDWDLITRVAVWGVGFGVIGARLYHDITSWSEVPSPKWKGIFEVWQGGLGVWGGILFGTIAGAIVVHHAGYSVTKFMDAAAPGLLLAQGIGRIGNWWNQELFGKPTTLPWALRISPSHNPYASTVHPYPTTFHPTFLYESIWDLCVVGIVLLVERRLRLRQGSLLAVYVAAYTVGRFFTEYERIDTAHKIGPLRLNDWTSIVVFVAAVLTLVLFNRPRPGPTEPGAAPPPVDTEATVAEGAASGDPPHSA
jgi:prolipoprotein diacylglyceryl transferase